MLYKNRGSTTLTRQNTSFSSKTVTVALTAHLHHFSILKPFTHSSPPSAAFSLPSSPSCALLSFVPLRPGGMAFQRELWSLSATGRRVFWDKEAFFVLSVYSGREFPGAILYIPGLWLPLSSGCNCCMLFDHGDFCTLCCSRHPVNLFIYSRLLEMLIMVFKFSGLSLSALF